MDIREFAKKQIEGSVIKTQSGLKLYTPDGEGNYAALWTRDFYYMIDDAGELFDDPADIRKCLEYTLLHARDVDCWIPDRVDAKGFASYTAGDWDKKGYPLPNLDNNAFAVLSAQRYKEIAGEGQGNAFISQWKNVLVRALQATPVDENGIIYNDPDKPHSPYGFTDCVCKTGLLSMDTLIQWQAYKIAASWGVPGFAELAQRVEEHFEEVFFPDGRALPLAATVDCRETDLWAACYGMAIGFPFKERRRRAMLQAIVAQYDEITEAGQMCHCLPGEKWEKSFNDLPYGKYQNGAFWATPSGWLIKALQKDYPALAEKTLRDLLEYMEKFGCYECVRGEYKKLPNYVASATAAYGAAKALRIEK